MCKNASTQQTQDVCITFVQRRPNVFNVGPTLYKCYTIVLCWLGSDKDERVRTFEVDQT